MATKKVSRAEMIRLVEQANKSNKFWVIEKYIKKDGSFMDRKQVRGGVSKYVKGTGKTNDNPNMITVWINNNKQEAKYRTLYLARIEEVTINGQTLSVA